MMSEIPDCTEVLVVGAGPVGLAVAASLTGHGHDVAREIKPPARPTAPGAPVSGNGSVGQSTGARQQMIMSS
jgi:NADPH-dependent 2,4-dienoyl-CoA reductase/sulfur reductase-like enzyme